MQKITLRECSLRFLEKNFGLKEISSHKNLTDWLKKTYILTQKDKIYLEILQSKLIKNVVHWNEYELVANFIVPMFTAVNFTTSQFNDFGERNIQAEIGDYFLSGNPDGMIASGFREPEIPYFVFQEYKPQSDPSGEPTGQCLAAMLVGQTLNQHKNVMYGCTVIGRDWFFLVLDGKEYAMSKSFSVDDEEIEDVYRILQGLKEILLENVANL